MRRTTNALAAIEYVGLPGISEESKQAIMRMIHYRDQIAQARILSHDRNHCFLLTVNVGDLVAVKSGFSSGYLGEGPRAFSYVLQLLDAHGVDIEEYDVTANVIERVDISALRQQDIHAIDKARPIRPTRWYDYIIDERFKRGDYAKLWQEFNPVIPLAIVDARITDLAMRFYQAPDDCLGKAIAALRTLFGQESIANSTGQSFSRKRFWVRMQSYPGPVKPLQKGRRDARFSPQRTGRSETREPIANSNPTVTNRRWNFCFSITCTRWSKRRSKSERDGNLLSANEETKLGIARR